MEINKLVLKPAGIWMVLGGLLTLISPMYLVYDKAIDTVVGILMTLIFILLSSYEIAAGRSSWSVEEGAYPGIMRALALAFAARAALLVTTSGDLFIANVVFLLGEVGIFGFIFTRKELFMPSEEERKATMKRISGPAMVSLAECPNCKAVVEMTWESCPYCGTELPKLCAKCGHRLDETMAICPNCGAEVEEVKTLEASIASLKASAEEEVAPETRAGRYAKLAEALLKTGRNQEALDAYTEAIKHSQYNRKRCYFMVKMARILKNMGEKNRALEILDEAIKLDPEDYAGAASMKESLLKPETEAGVASPQAS